MKVLAWLSGITICFINCSYATGDSTLDKNAEFSTRIITKLNDRTTSLDDQLTNQTGKYLSRMAGEEAKLKNKLFKLDSAAASRLYANNPEQEYAALLQKLKTAIPLSNPSMGPEYLPYVDSIKGGLSFLNKNPQLLANSKLLPSEVQNALSQFQLLQTKLQNADQIQQFIQSRKAQMQQILSQYSNLPSGISNIYNNYNKEIYYYSEQVREYRQMLNDPDKMVQTALQLLNKIPAFTAFMQKNSFLAGLFNVPGNYGTAEGMVGLQSRDQVLALIQSHISGGGTNAMSMLQQNLQTAQQDINKIRDKLNALGAGSGNMDMPNFKPQNQKTKTFFKRLEYGTNLETQHASYYFPTTTKISLSVAYLLDDKKSIGLTGGYNIGWGSDISHIKVSNQGYSGGAFIEMQLKKNIFISGGYSLNFQPPVGSYQLQTNLTNIQRSGTIGIGKIVKINSNVFKKTKVQILWDFLSYSQVPRPTPFIFQAGYTF